MWTALFPNWKNFRIYSFKESAKSMLERLFSEPFILKCLKIPKSHRNFLLTFASSDIPNLFLKLYIPHPFRKNRVKTYLKTLLELKKLGVSLLEPQFIFWENPWLAFLKNNPFYGGIVFSYYRDGFLNIELSRSLLPRLVRFLFSLHEKGVYLRDTKFTNFYSENRREFKIFDLDGVKIFKKPLTKKKRLKGLATLAMTLEWEGVNSLRKLIWDEYAKLYPELKEDDYIIYEKFIALRQKKREAHLLKARSLIEL